MSANFGFDERLRDVEMSSQRTADRINSHEEICAERYANINDTLAALKRVLFWFGAVLMAGMAAILVRQVWP
jgi:hypothetical protein